MHASNLRRIGFLWLLVFCLGALMPAPGQCKPLPPRDLQETFQAFGQWENVLETRQWDRVREGFGILADRVRDVVARTRRDTGKDLSTKAEGRLRAVQTGISREAFGTAYRASADLQNLFFEIMDLYAFDVHPIARILPGYLDEAREGLEKGEWDEIAFELAEVRKLVDDNRRIFLTHGVATEDLAIFGKTAALARRAALRKERRATRKLLEQLDQLLAGMTSKITT